MTRFIEKYFKKKIALLLHEFCFTLKKSNSRFSSDLRLSATSYTGKYLYHSIAYIYLMRPQWYLKSER